MFPSNEAKKAYDRGVVDGGNSVTRILPKINDNFEHRYYLVGYNHGRDLRITKETNYPSEEKACYPSEEKACV